MKYYVESFLTKTKNYIKLYLQAEKKVSISDSSWLVLLINISVNESSSVPGRAIVSWSSMDRNFVMLWVSIVERIKKFPDKSSSKSATKL